MTDHSSRARTDLERLSPAVWVEVYAGPILDDLEAATGLAVRQGHQLQKSTESIVGLLHVAKALRMLSSAVMSFETATGWHSGDDRKHLRLTPARWAAAKALAAVAKAASSVGMLAVKPFIESVAKTAAKDPVEGFDRVLEVLRKRDPTSEKGADLESTLLRLREMVANKTAPN